MDNTVRRQFKTEAYSACEQVLVLNAFSAGMLPDVAGVEKWTVTFQPIADAAAANDWLAWKSEQGIKAASAVGHADTARLLSTLLGGDIPAARIDARLDDSHSESLLCQYSGPRLPEGTTELPEGATIKFFVVTVSYTMKPQGGSYSSHYDELE